MSDTGAEIAAAVAAWLNTETFAIPFTATAGWQAIIDATDRADLTVTVTPASKETEPATRARDFNDYATAVNLTADLLDSTVDGLAALAGDVFDFLNEPNLPGYPDAHLIKIAHAPVVDPERLRRREFFSLIMLTYRALE